MVVRPKEKGKILNRKTYFIRERVGFMKFTNTYDILDPETKEQLGIAKEKPGVLFHVLRLIIDKRLLPTEVFVYEGDNPEDESQVLFSIRRGVTLLISKVRICDASRNEVGWLESKMFSLGEHFASSMP